MRKNICRTWYPSAVIHSASSASKSFWMGKEFVLRAANPSWTSLYLRILKTSIYSRCKAITWNHGSMTFLKFNKSQLTSALTTSSHTKRSVRIARSSFALNVSYTNHTRCTRSTTCLMQLTQSKAIFTVVSSNSYQCCQIAFLTKSVKKSSTKHRWLQSSFRFTSTLSMNSIRNRSMRSNSGQNEWFLIFMPSRLRSMKGKDFKTSSLQSLS